MNKKTIATVYEVYDLRGEPDENGFSNIRKIAALNSKEEAERFVEVVSTRYPIDTPIGNNGYAIKTLDIVVEKFNSDEEIINKLKSVPLGALWKKGQLME